MNDTSVSVTVEQPEPGLCVLRLNLPGCLNALDLPALRQFHQVLDGVLCEPALRVLVIAAEGAGFYAGLDLKSGLDAQGHSQLDVASSYELQLCFAGLIKRLRASDATVIGCSTGRGRGHGHGAHARRRTPSA